MSSFVVPGKFVFTHMPKSGGAFFTENVTRQAGVIPFGNGNHGKYADIPDAFRHLPKVGIVRESVDWIESLFNYNQRNGWNKDDEMTKSSFSEDIDVFVRNVMVNHPYIMSDFHSAFCDKSDYLIDHSDLVNQSRSVLKVFGLDVVDESEVNYTPRISRLSREVADEWSCHNLNLAERYGWNMPSGPVFQLPDWSGWWQQTCEFLKPMFFGKPIRLLEIGVCEGRSAIHSMKTILSHRDSTYTGVDIWDLNPRDRAVKNISHFSERMSSQPIISTGYWPVSMYDVIYIDGDHSHQGCAEDLKKAWPMLKDNGILVVDDYGCDMVVSPHPGVKSATDSFLESVDHREIRIQENYYQKVVQRTK